MKALVTGSGGFVGGHLVHDLFLYTGENVLILDKKYGREHDLSDPDTVDRYVPYQPEVIFHLASTCSTPGSLIDPLGTFRDTVVTAAHAMDLARRAGALVILTSSVKARDGKTPYGAAKQCVEIWAQEYAAAFGIPLIINRPGTIYGPGQEGSPESGWVAWFLKAKREGIPVTINGDGRQVRDLLYVSDYVDLMIRQAMNPSIYLNRIWDVGGGSANVVSVLEMVQYLGLEYTFGPERYGDARTYVGINDAPDWEPQTFWKETGIFR